MHPGTQPHLAADTAEDAVMIVMMQIGRRMRQRHPEDAIDPAAIPILFSLRCTGAVRLSDLASRLRLDASTVSRHVRQLEDRGLLVRTEDPDDRRASRVDLAPEGAAHLDQLFDHRRSAIAEVLSGWDDADRETLRSVLERFARDLGAYNTEDSTRAGR